MRQALFGFHPAEFPRTEEFAVILQMRRPPARFHLRSPRIAPQVHRSRRYRNLDSFVLELPQDPPAELIPDPELRRELHDLIIHRKSQPRIPEPRVELDVRPWIRQIGRA